MRGARAPRTAHPLATPDGFPDLSQEHDLAARGYGLIAGIDEAGRGSWAGPLVAAAVCLPVFDEALPSQLRGVRDSKQLTPIARQRLYSAVVATSIDFGLGIVSPAVIDRLGLAIAGELAMYRAMMELSRSPECLLLDAFTIRGCTVHQRPIIRGDQISLSIASASIIAKVSRDRIMQAAHYVYPGYGLAINKGYGTRRHAEAIQLLGPSSYHRESFQPIRTARGICS